VLSSKRSLAGGPSCRPAAGALAAQAEGPLADPARDAAGAAATGSAAAPAAAPGSSSRRRTAADDPGALPAFYTATSCLHTARRFSGAGGPGPTRASDPGGYAAS